MKFKKLNKFNLRMSALHAIQGLLILLISEPAMREITSSYLSFNPVTETLEPASVVLFEVNIAIMIAAFFFISAFAHLSVATFGRKSYEKNLKKGMNKVRWYEYSVSASIMIVLIAMLSGIFDIGTLMAVFGLTAVMNLLGLAMEVHNQTTTKTNWLTYNIGVVAGIIPWFVIGAALYTAEVSANGDVPGFVYAIYASLFLFFNTFAINMILQYKKVGKWSDYLYGERTYIILSLVAKSALAWQIYAGTLQP
jgi:hypothetical protein